MPNERLLRYSIAGVSFIVFILFFQYFFGRDLPELRDVKFTNLVIAFISFFFSVPVLGIIVSTIIFQIREWSAGMDIYYRLPPSREVEDWVLADPSYRSKEIEKIKKLRELNLDEKERPKNRSEYVKKYFPYYQIKVRQHITGESLSYLERKIAVYYVHMNIKGSIVIGLIYGIGYAIYTQAKSLILESSFALQLDINEYKIAGLIVVIVYYFFAQKLGSLALEHATTFEHLMLDKAYKSEIDKQTRAKLKMNFSAKLTI